MSRRARASLAGCAVAVAAALAVPPAADANFVYWTNDGGTTIGRAKLNGSGPNNSFISGLKDPLGVAVDETFIYWTQGTGADSSIGRALLDGSQSSPALIPASAGVNNPAGIAVDANFIYWIDEMGNIGRALKDGTSPTPNFVTAPGTHCGLAVDANFIYWNDSAGNRIGRAGINGAGANPSFISGISTGCGVASNATNLYWGTKAPLTSIGRSALSGASPTNAFISSASSAPSPCGVAVNSQYIFWGNIPGLAVGRANLSGSGKNPGRVPGATTPCLPVAAPSNKITFTKTVYNLKKGTAKLEGKVSGPGQISVASTTDGGGKTVKPIGLTLTKSGPFTLPVKPKGKPAKALKKKGKAKLNVFVTYTPAGIAGVTNSDKRTLSLKKNVKKKKKK